MAAIDIYGVMSYSVRQRTQELGVRMALGAQASNLRNMVIRQGMALTLIGVAVGVGGAFWRTRFLTSFLFGVTTWDPIPFGCDASAAERRCFSSYLVSGQTSYSGRSHRGTPAGVAAFM